MPTRRDAIGAALVTLLSPTEPIKPDQSGLKKRDQSLVCEAPDDVTVERLELLQGRVTVGQPLATLTSTRLRWLRSRLDSSAAELQVQRRAFTEGRVDQLREVLKEEVASARAASEASDTLLKFQEKSAGVATVNALDVVIAKQAAAESQMKLSEAEKDQVRSESKFNDMKDRLDISEIRLKREQEILLDLTRRLTVAAPADGLFVASVGPGGFVAAGDPIGLIYPGMAKLPRQELICAAPDDVKVIDLKVQYGQVKSGQLIATLVSAKLAHYRSQLDSLAADLEVQRRPFTDGRIERLEAILNQEVESAMHAYESADKYSKVRLKIFGVGTDVLTNVIELPSKAAAAKTKLASAKVDKQQFPMKVKDMKDRIEIAATKLRKETEIFEELTRRMTLVAPGDGLFVASVGVGGFVQSGDPIGVLYL
jgi:hypothetical protein